MLELPPHHFATRYLQPLREGGSLPAVVDTTGGRYVVKFRGAGQGPRALVAELIVGRLATVLGLPVPELALIDVPPELGRTEGDPEIQDLLQASVGVNIGLRYLDGAFNFDATAAGEFIDATLAARIVWLDALVTNPDRSARNPNLLVWQRKPWLIDHGAALYAHHAWESVDEARTRTRFPLIEQHVLLTVADDLRAADEALAAILDDATLESVLAGVPDALLSDASDAPEAATLRQRYQRYFRTRLEGPRAFVDEAIAAQARVRAQPRTHLKARR